jgi:hypothetical protein
MNEKKIKKVAYWINNKSENRLKDIEWLLYGLYGFESSGLPTDIDEAFGDVIDLTLEEEE